MNSERYLKLGIYSSLTGFAFLLASLLLFAASMVPESGTYAAQDGEKVFLSFTFLIAPLFYLVGGGLAVGNFFEPNGTRKFLAIFGALLNGLGLFFAVLGWILFLLFLLVLYTAKDFVGPWR
jgi:hypothetical protein